MRIADLATVMARHGVTSEALQEILETYAAVVEVEAPYAGDEIAISTCIGLNIKEMLEEME